MPDRPDGPTETPNVAPIAPDAESIETYRIGDATVLYDAENPLAWIESSFVVSIDDAA